MTVLFFNPSNNNLSFIAVLFYNSSFTVILSSVQVLQVLSLLWQSLLLSNLVFHSGFLLFQSSVSVLLLKLLVTITTSCSTDIHLVLDITWTYIGVCSILDLYLLQSTISHLLFILYQLAPHVIVKALLYFPLFLLIILFIDIVYFLYSLRYIQQQIQSCIFIPYQLIISLILSQVFA